MIHERGLLSTLLFLQKKQTEVESALVKKIMDWLSDLVPEEEENLIEYLIGSCTLAQEQMLTKEALMFVKWVSRCIEARESQRGFVNIRYKTAHSPLPAATRARIIRAQ